MGIFLSQFRRMTPHWTSHHFSSCLWILLALSLADPVPSFAAAPASSNAASPPTNVSHVLFGIAGSVKTWEKRRASVELWWRPGVTKGYVWLDEDPPGGAESWPATSPPYRVSQNVSRFGPMVIAARIARIVKEAYMAVAAEGTEEVRWLVMGDDDTVFFPDNLAAVLRKYDHREMYYIGGISESVEQDVVHSYRMAFGGGGYAISIAAAREIAPVFDGCLVRYAGYYGGDERVHSCMSEIGVPLTRELGFHQVDIRGNLFGLLTSHPVAPLVSLHHLDSVDTLFPDSPTQLQAVGRLVNASLLDPARTLQQTICYLPKLNWSVSVSWGYAAQIYPYVITPDVLERSIRTFQTWGSYQDGPFVLDTRPRSPDGCDLPAVFFLDRVRWNGTSGGSMTTYKKQTEGMNADGCGRPDFNVASMVEAVRVVAPVMDPDDWKKAPRRQCCEARRSWWGTTVDVKIRRCRQGA